MPPAERRRRSQRDAPTAPNDSYEPSTLEEVATAVPSRRTSILVVEDDPVLLSFYKGALLMSGFIVTTAFDGLDALLRLESSTPDLIVLDLGLPRVSGYDFSREIATRADTRHIPIVVVTGQTDADAAEFACLLYKPVEADALIAAVERCLRRDGARGF